MQPKKYTKNDPPNKPKPTEQTKPQNQAAFLLLFVIKFNSNFTLTEQSKIRTILLHETFLPAAFILTQPEAVAGEYLSLPLGFFVEVCLYSIKIPVKRKRGV